MYIKVFLKKNKQKNNNISATILFLPADVATNEKNVLKKQVLVLKIDPSFLLQAQSNQYGFAGQPFTPPRSPMSGRFLTFGSDTPPRSPMSGRSPLPNNGKEISTVSISVTYTDGETSVMQFLTNGQQGYKLTPILNKQKKQTSHNRIRNKQRLIIKIILTVIIINLKKIFRQWSIPCPTVASRVRLHRFQPVQRRRV